MCEDIWCHCLGLLWSIIGVTFLAVLNTVTGHIQSSKFRPFSHLLLIICAVKIYTGTIWLQEISYEKLLTYSVLLHYFKSDYYVPYISVNWAVTSKVQNLDHLVIYYQLYVLLKLTLELSGCRKYHMKNY